MAGLGEEFRAAREARGLSLSEVADRLHIRSLYLAAIEDEDWSAIGAPVYVRGFLRTYARFLGLDVESAVDRFGKIVPSSPPDDEPRLRMRRRGTPIGLWIGGTVAVVLVLFVLWNYYQLEVSRHAAAPAPHGNVQTPAQVAAVATQAPAPPQAHPGPRATRAAAGSKALALRFSQSSWVRVAIDGQVAMEGTYPAGTARSFKGRRATLRIGNAGGVDVAVDGKDVGKLGAPGDVVERSFTIAGE